MVKPQPELSVQPLSSPFPLSFETIDRTQYPDVHFIDNPVVITMAAPPKVWRQQSNTTVGYSIYYPPNYQAHEYRLNLGVCLPDSCQDYPFYVDVSQSSLADKFKEFAECEKHKKCFGKKMAVAPLEFGTRRGLAIWYDRLNYDDAKTKSTTGANPLPNTQEPAILMLNDGMYTFIIYAPYQEPVYAQILASFTFP